ncbi:hypothetical protein SAMN05216191_13026 [Paenibacillus jilunlii]|uniref:Uncharacterized protein n=1 Tax=Paenibacillus jilunlii TaxID=682956 RepID=A0A1G9ZAG1_9BACL|nr:hypothetical protein SAMN05216191_13026 [Paenibacillus jilunlii]
MHPAVIPSGKKITNLLGHTALRAYVGKSEINEPISTHNFL